MRYFLTLTVICLLACSGPNNSNNENLCQSTIHNYRELCSTQSHEIDQFIYGNQYLSQTCDSDSSARAQCIVNDGTCNAYTNGTVSQSVCDCDNSITANSCQ